MGTRRGRSLRAVVTGSLLVGTVVVGSVVVGSPPASANTPVSLYVSTTGSDGGGSNTCTASGTPCLTIQQAINEAQSNYSTTDDVTINVAAGTYLENDTISASGLNSLTIVGAGASMATLDGSNGSSSVVLIHNGTVVISGFTITNGFNSFGGVNPAGGGGIFNQGTLSLGASTVSNNLAASGLRVYGANGGGIFNGGTMSITDSTISDNTAVHTGGPLPVGGAGGGIYNQGTMSIADSTVSGNTADVSGGGIYQHAGALTITDSTISGNTAEYDGGIADIAGTGSLGATIMASNAGGNCVPGGTITSVGYNLTDDASCGLSQPTDVTAAVVLGALGNNGGTTDTILPPASSLAVGAIPTGTTLNGVQVCPRSDQRGVSSFGNCTVGAVEGGFLIVAPPLPDATPGVAYGPIALTTQEVGVSTSPHVTTLKWTKIEAPKGMNLSSAGVLSWKPGKKLIPGTLSVVAQVTETVTTVTYGRKSIARTTVQATIPLRIT